MSSCVERFGETVEAFIGSAFYSLGLKVGNRPRWTIGLALLATVIMGAGFATWEVENREDKLWVPQNTIAEEETNAYQALFPTTSRFNQMIVQGKSSKNVLTKEALVGVMTMHSEIASQEITVDGETLILENICTKAGGSCASKFDGVCTCLINSILKQWNYDLDTLVADEDYMTTLNMYGTKEDFEAVLGNAQFDSDDTLVSADAFSLTYFIEDRSEVVDGTEIDEIGETWEEEVFLDAAESVSTTYSTFSVDYLATRSFGDEFGDASKFGCVVFCRHCSL